MGERWGMNNREIDAKVAEALGWVWQWYWEWPGPDYKILYRRTLVVPECANEWEEKPTNDDVVSTEKDISLVPHYTTDHAVSRTMEDWIAEQPSALHWRYAQAMNCVLLEQGIIPQHEEDYVWLFLYATPLQRCLAFLAAMGVEVEK